MKGFSILLNEINKKRILQIDIKELLKEPEKFEDMVDILIAKERENEKEISWEDAKKKLRKSGKL